MLRKLIFFNQKNEQHITSRNQLLLFNIPTKKKMLSLISFLGKQIARIQGLYMACVGKNVSSLFNYRDLNSL